MTGQRHSRRDFLKTTTAAAAATTLSLAPYVHAAGSDETMPPVSHADPARGSRGRLASLLNPTVPYAQKQRASEQQYQQKRSSPA